MPLTPRRTPLLPVAGLILLAIAAAAAVHLRLLVALYERSMRAASTRSALDYGQAIVRDLAGQPPLSGAAFGPGEAAQLDRLVGALAAVDPSLEYVEVSGGGAILYHRQARRPPPGAAGSAAPVRIGRRNLRTGTHPVPVLTFTLGLAPGSAPPRDVQVAFRKSVLDRSLAGARRALTSMFWMSLGTLAAAFGLSLLALFGLVRRERFWQSRQRLHEQAALSGALAAGLIHDFRNPMSAMRLDAQMMRRELAKGGAARPERLDDLAGRIGRTLDRLESLLSEFLATHRPETGARQPFDAAACARDCADLVRPRFDQTGIRLRLEISTDPLPAYGFPVSFKRGLLNVLHNAEQVSPRGGAVLLTARREGSRAVIAVTDEGPGVARADRRRIFDLFFSRRPGGTGLGLALARSAAAASGGTLDLETPETGTGSRFVFRLPLRAPHEPQPPANAGPRPPASGEAAP